MSKVTQSRRMTEALQEIYDTAKLFKDIVYMHEVITRIKKLSKAALQKSPTKETAAIWTMMNWEASPKKECFHTSNCGHNIGWAGEPPDGK